MREMEQLKLYSLVPLLRVAEEYSLSYPEQSVAIGAFNANFRAQADGILEGLKRAEAPGIIQASRGANNFQKGPDKIQQMVLASMKSGGYNLPIALHLDHGTLPTCIQCIDNKFSSVMIDASDLPDFENIVITREITDYAHRKGVSAEAELGHLSGVEEDIEHQNAVYADPVFVPVFFKRTKVDVLAPAYGTSHGSNKGKTEALKTEIVRDSYRGLRAYGMNMDHFLCGHGSSTVPLELIVGINYLGGTLKGAKGIPEAKIREAINYGLRKINIDTDLRLRITYIFRKYFADHRGIERVSVPLGLIKAVFDGIIQAKDKEKVVEPGNLVDPRSYLQPLMSEAPDFLREDYNKLGDEPFAEVMSLIKEGVAEDVARLSKMFGAAGLADKIRF